MHLPGPCRRHPAAEGAGGWPQSPAGRRPGGGQQQSDLEKLWAQAEGAGVVLGEKPGVDREPSRGRGGVLPPPHPSQAREEPIPGIGGAWVCGARDLRVLRCGVMENGSERWRALYPGLRVSAPGAGPPDAGEEGWDGRLVATSATASAIRASHSSSAKMAALLPDVAASRSGQPSRRPACREQRGRGSHVVPSLLGRGG